MGKKYSIYSLIILSVLIIYVLFVPDKVLAYKEAGASASISVHIDENNTRDIAIKRAVMRKVFERYNSPFVGEVDNFIATCEKYRIDCYLLPSISGLESSFGRFTWPESHNPFGWGGGYIMFPTWASAFDAVGKGIREMYIDKWHADSIETMAGYYAESPTWAPRVRYFHDVFEQTEQEHELHFAKVEVEW